MGSESVFVVTLIVGVVLAIAIAVLCDDPNVHTGLTREECECKCTRGIVEWNPDHVHRWTQFIQVGKTMIPIQHHSHTTLCRCKPEEKAS